jgi:hypothetical protein
MIEVRARRLLWLAIPILLVACDQDRVEVEIRPKLDGTVERTVRFFRVDPDKPGVILPPREELLAGAASHYKEPLETADASVAFTGEFRGVPPDITLKDWTNRGGYDVWRSRVGAFAVYRERRPGPTDYRARYRAAAKGVDTLSAVLSRMFRTELKGEVGLDRLLTFLRGSFRADAKDLLLLLTGTDLAQDLTGSRARLTALGRDAYGDPGLRETSTGALALELLAERGYLRIAELPRLATDPGRREWVGNQIARRMGRTLDRSLRARLAFLFDDAARKAAFARALDAKGLTDEEYEALVAPLVGAASQLDSRGGSTISYSVALPAGATIVSTSAAKGTSAGDAVAVFPFDERPVRSLYHVEFAVPDDAWQAEHFGGLVLDGGELRDYVMWLEGLPAPQRKAWEAAMQKTRPGDGLWPAIRAIRVTGGPPDEPEEGARIFARAFHPEPK